ncbi:MAG TPA: hypothetical protein VK541_11570 [Pedobacter sp.]|uniref:hypothetical protein n=1 Tax=Pedobacter sp. TaxID=1411316 RepID=UPI002BAE3173|nr:hypothetical protein [Pedobacter sp.]HMI03115.1 hypothetical protein [Pedobacter sp.]
MEVLFPETRYVYACRVFEEGRDYPSIRAVLYEELTLLITRLNMLVNGEEGLEWKDLM